MRSAVAISVALLLVSLVTVCPLLSCAGNDPDLSHACCHKHSSGTPCAPQTKVQHCVYSLLDRSTPAPAAMAAVAPAVISTPGIPETTGRTLTGIERPADSRGLHLRIHVLRI